MTGFQYHQLSVQCIHSVDIFLGLQHQILVKNSQGKCKLALHCQWTTKDPELSTLISFYRTFLLNVALPSRRPLAFYFRLAALASY